MSYLPAVSKVLEYVDAGNDAVVAFIQTVYAFNIACLMLGAVHILLRIRTFSRALAVRMEYARFQRQRSELNYRLGLSELRKFFAAVTLIAGYMLVVDFVIDPSESERIRFLSNDLAGNYWHTLRIGIWVTVLHIFFSYLMIAMRTKTEKTEQRIAP